MFEIFPAQNVGLLVVCSSRLKITLVEYRLNKNK